MNFKLLKGCVEDLYNFNIPFKLCVHRKVNNLQEQDGAMGIFLTEMKQIQE